MDLADGVEARVLALMRSRIGRARERHTLEVAGLAAELCARFGVPRAAGRIAALGHDVARELGPEEIRRVAAEDGRPFDSDETEMPLLLHGRASAVLLRREAAIEDREVLDAVSDHVTGRPGMGKLSLVLYAADYFEPTRGIMAEEERRAALAGPLEAIVLAALRGTVAYLTARRKRVARVTLELESWLQEELRRHGQ